MLAEEIFNHLCNYYSPQSVCTQEYAIIPGPALCSEYAISYDKKGLGLRKLLKEVITIGSKFAFSPLVLYLDPIRQGQPPLLFSFYFYFLSYLNDVYTEL